MGRSKIDIDDGLLTGLRRLAEERGREERELLEEAVRTYLQHGPPNVAGIGIGGEVSGGRDEFIALLERMSSRFDLDEEETMRIAVEEQHAWRRERRRAEGDPPS